MRLDYGSGDGQSQAGATHATTARLVSSVETVEDMGKVRRVNADAVIGDGNDQRGLALHPRTDCNAPSGIGAIDGVADDVAQRLAQAHPVQVQAGEMPCDTSDISTSLAWHCGCQRSTSTTCGNCQYRDRNNRKNQAEFLCFKCHHAANADHNAAQNILQRGRGIIILYLLLCRQAEAGGAHCGRRSGRPSLDDRPRHSLTPTGAAEPKGVAAAGPAPSRHRAHAV